MKQAAIEYSRSNDLELLQSFSARASLSPGIIAGLSRNGRFNLIIALHEFTGQFSGLTGGWESEGKSPECTLN